MIDKDKYKHDKDLLVFDIWKHLSEDEKAELLKTFPNGNLGQSEVRSYLIKNYRNRVPEIMVK